ncbi:tRNA pseudouridine(38-40) synthase TruA [Bacillus sp. 31A1R]|uniref:tRNA pseudouridine synthase A n=1 Tax=Robertmurraya mangrovi TaxID=3098077 RepID=A0ABU5J479_9BACI|nr:tRNA pseudouridine(38-40) synthase TruA [Bacillus sp. 31A1R]MDZ5474231.1 tRNA pseudouridine(38-40) synthase TruA [Bacillus sp. 31A1R]
MQRFKCKIAYDGSQFSGYQVQPSKRTVQSELENTLKKLHKGQEVKVYASGRTDAGVHAKGQVIHFDSPLTIPLERWIIALNSLLPNDIVVLEVEQVEDNFHARFQAKGKEYRYFVNLSNTRDPFQRNFSYHHPYKLDIQSMNDAAKYLLGSHDFTSFCSAKTEVEDKIREIRKIELIQQDTMLIFRFVGNGFLYNMVRIMVGTLIQVGSGQINPGSIKEIIEHKDRKYAGKTAPAEGLYLWEVYYD